MTLEQATKIIKLLEMNSGIYDLEIQEIPIWWFIRPRFHQQLLSCSSSKPKEKKKNVPQKNVNSRKMMGIILKCRKILVFVLRSLKTLIQIKIHRLPQKSIMFLAYPGDFKKGEEGRKYDIFIDPICQKLTDPAVIIERPILKSQDFHSFMYRKNVIFFDWFLLISVLKNWLKLWRNPKTTNWEKFEKKIKEINFEIVSVEWIIETIKKLIFSLKNKIIIQVDAAEIILNRFKPRIIVETSSYDSCTIALNLMAKKRNIFIIELQHGIITKTHIGYTYFIPSDYAKNKPLPDKILVYGEAFKKPILRTGNAFSSKDIIVTGFPRLNNFLSQAQPKREFIRAETRKKLGIDNNIFLVTITSQPITNSYLSHFLEKAIPLLEKDIIICIKLHPFEIDNWKLIYQNIVHYPKLKIVTDSTVDLYKLLIASDIHITVSSTTFLECLALEVPNIILKGPSHSCILELVNQDKIIIVNTPKDFIKELSKLKQDERYRKMIIEKGKEISNSFFTKKDCPESLIIEEIVKHHNLK